MGLFDKWLSLSAKFNDLKFLKQFDKFSQKIIQRGFLLGACIVVFGMPYYIKGRLYANKIQDVSLDYLMASQNKKKKGNLAKDRILEDALKLQNVDNIQWASLGMLCSEDGKPELAFHCYHMLHLTNPNKFKTNSDLAIETNVQPENQRQGQDGRFNQNRSGGGGGFGGRGGMRGRQMREKEAPPKELLEFGDLKRDSLSDGEDWGGDGTEKEKKPEKKKENFLNQTFHSETKQEEISENFTRVTSHKDPRLKKTVVATKNLKKSQTENNWESRSSEINSWENNEKSSKIEDLASRNKDESEANEQFEEQNTTEKEDNLSKAKEPHKEDDDDSDSLISKKSDSLESKKSDSLESKKSDSLESKSDLDSKKKKQKCENKSQNNLRDLRSKDADEDDRWDVRDKEDTSPKFNSKKTDEKNNKSDLKNWDNKQNEPLEAENQKQSDLNKKDKQDDDIDEWDTREKSPKDKSVHEKPEKDPQYDEWDTREKSPVTKNSNQKRDTDKDELNDDWDTRDKSPESKSNHTKNADTDKEQQNDGWDTREKSSEKKSKLQKSDKDDFSTEKKQKQNFPQTALQQELNRKFFSGGKSKSRSPSRNRNKSRSKSKSKSRSRSRSPQKRYEKPFRNNQNREFSMKSLREDREYMEEREERDWGLTGNRSLSRQQDRKEEIFSKRNIFLSNSRPSNTFKKESPKTGSLFQNLYSQKGDQIGERSYNNNNNNNNNERMNSMRSFNINEERQKTNSFQQNHSNYGKNSSYSPISSPYHYESDKANGNKQLSLHMKSPFHYEYHQPTLTMKSPYHYEGDAMNGKQQMKSPFHYGNNSFSQSMKSPYHYQSEAMSQPFQKQQITEKNNPFMFMNMKGAKVNLGEQNKRDRWIKRDSEDWNLENNKDGPNKNGHNQNFLYAQNNNWRRRENGEESNADLFPQRQNPFEVNMYKNNNGSSFNGNSQVTQNRQHNYVGDNFFNIHVNNGFRNKFLGQRAGLGAGTNWRDYNEKIIDREKPFMQAIKLNTIQKSGKPLAQEIVIDDEEADIRAQNKQFILQEKINGAYGNKFMQRRRSQISQIQFLKKQDLPKSNYSQNPIEQSPIYEPNTKVSMKKQSILFNPDELTGWTMPSPSYVPEANEEIQQDYMSPPHHDPLSLENIYDFRDDLDFEDINYQSKKFKNSVIFYSEIQLQSLDPVYLNEKDFFERELLQNLFPHRENKDSCFLTYDGRIFMKKQMSNISEVICAKVMVYSNHPWSQLQVIPSLKQTVQQNRVKEFKSVDFTLVSQTLKKMIKRDQYERIFYLLWVEGPTIEDRAKIDSYADYLYNNHLVAGTNMENFCFTMAHIQQIFPSVQQFKRPSSPYPVKLVIIANLEVVFQIGHRLVPF